MDRREWVVQGLAADGSVEREAKLSDGEFAIGRKAEGLACPDDDQMADRHALLECSETGVTLRDLGVGSGVWVRIQGAGGRLLENNDELWVGVQFLVLRQDGKEWQIRHHGPDGRLRGIHDVPEGGLFIGRGSNLLASDSNLLGSGTNLVLDPNDGQLSRRHAQVAFVGGELRFFDRGAHNGSYLRLRAPESIGHGDEFRIATRLFRLAERILEASDLKASAGGEGDWGEATLLVPYNDEKDPLGAASSDSEPDRPGAALAASLISKGPSAEEPRAPSGLAARLRNLGGRNAEPQPHPQPQTAREVAADATLEGESGSDLVALVIDSPSGSISLEVKPGTTVLEAVQEAGLARGEPVDWECGDGGCGVCIVGIVEGADRFDPPDPATGEMKTIQITEQVAPDPRKYRLACLARVRGSVRLRKLI